MFKIKKYITRVKFGKKEFTYVSPILQTFSWEFEDLILADIFLGQKSGHYIDLGCMFYNIGLERNFSRKNKS